MISFFFLEYSPDLSGKQPFSSFTHRKTPAHRHTHAHAEKMILYWKKKKKLKANLSDPRYCFDFLLSSQLCYIIHRKTWRERVPMSGRCDGRMEGHDPRSLGL